MKRRARIRNRIRGGIRFSGKQNQILTWYLTYRMDRAFPGKFACRLSRHHADRLLAGRALDVEFDFAAHLGVQRMVLADADIVAGMDDRAALADDDAAGLDELPAVALDAQTFRLRIAAVA